MILMNHLPIDKNILTLALYRIYIQKRIRIQVVCENKKPLIPFRNRCFPDESTSETEGLTIFIAVDFDCGMAKNAMW